LFESIRHTSSGAHVKLIRAQVVDALGDQALARSLAEDALTMLEDRPADAAIARYTIATLALAQGKPQDAIDELEPAIAAVAQLDIPPLHADLLHLEGRAFVAMGKLDRAAASLQSAVAQIERVRGSLQAERFRAAFLKSRSLLDLVRGALDLTQAAASESGESPESDLLQELSRLRGDLNALYSRLNRGGQDNQRRVLGPEWHEALHLRESRFGPCACSQGDGVD
jgi:tetratricopeptide (TPR) repeat protein